MMIHTCPNCGTRFPVVKARRAAVTLESLLTSTATMTEPEVRAYYKRTAPLGDIDFFLRTQTARLSPDLLARAITLQAAIAENGGKHTTDTKREYARVQELWRVAAQNQAVLTANLAGLPVKQEQARRLRQIARASQRIAA